jgi:two-component system sensor histidine kinase UhpB
VSFPLENGVVAASLALSSFEPVSEEDHAFAEDTVISIVDEQGFMVARSSDAKAWVGKNVRGQGVVDIALSRRSGYVIAPGLMGIERVFGFAAVPGTPWVAYAGVRSDAVFEHARSTAWQNAALAVLVILITAVLVVLVSERIGAPIRAIARTARAVADGRLDVRAPASGGGELGAVSAEFNRMLDHRVESERLLQQVIDTVPAIIHVKDLEGRYRLVNREFERVTGVRDAVGKRDSQLFAAEMVEIITAHDRAALERPGVLLVEESLNERHYIVGKAAMRDADGKARFLCTAAFNITQRKELEERQRRLSRRVFEVSEEERLRLSRELHDRIGQPLAALRINLDVLRARFPSEAQSELERQAVLVDELIRLVRTLTAQLRPPELEHVGLAAALRNYAEQASARYGFTVDVLGSEFSPRLPRTAERALFRIAQEALANAAKHAKAETVTIELDEADGEALVCVADDGRGFEATASREGVGLHTMRERAEEAGGRLVLESAEGRGTRVIAAVPRPR